MRKSNLQLKITPPRRGLKDIEAHVLDAAVSAQTLAQTARDEADRAETAAAALDLSAVQAAVQTYADAEIAKISPGMQPIFGLWPNQCGEDSDDSGTPDGWILPANDGFTAWALAGQTTYGSSDNIVSASIEEEFLASIPGSNLATPGWRNHLLSFWRFSWDISSGDVPDTLVVMTRSDVPYQGMAAMWVKEETANVFDNGSLDFIKGENDWSIWYGGATPVSNLVKPGGYYHPQFELTTASLPATGSILIAGPQAIPCRYDIESLGWGIWPGLNRHNSSGYELSFITDTWSET